MINDIQARLKKDEWLYLIEKYPYVAFNYKHCSSGLNSREKGFRYLYIAEPLITMPLNWDIKVIEQYSGCITWNGKFYEKHKNVVQMIHVPGCIACNSYYHLGEFIPYDRKIKGVCILNKLYHTGGEGDILYLREKIVQDIKNMILTHVWAPGSWGGKCSWPFPPIPRL